MSCKDASTSKPTGPANGTVLGNGSLQMGSGENEVVRVGSSPTGRVSVREKGEGDVHRDRHTPREKPQDQHAAIGVRLLEAGDCQERPSRQELRDAKKTVPWSRWAQPCPHVIADWPPAEL